LIDAPSYVISALRQKYTYQNTKYFILRYLNISTEPFIKTYQEAVTNSHHIFSLGIGTLEDIIALLQQYNVPYELIDKRHDSNVVLDIKKNFCLRDYQERLVNELLNSNTGILCAPCGSGKTVMGLAIIERLKKPTLILVHTNELLKQWVKEISEKLIFDFKIGICGNGIYQLSYITVALLQALQTLSRNDFNKLNELFSCVIGDECHHYSAVVWGKIFSSLKAKYKYGLTATIQRTDGLEFIIYDNISHKIVSINDDELLAHKQIMDVAVEFILSYAFKFEFDPDFHTWTHLIDLLIKNEERNLEIANHVVRDVLSGHIVLVLSERISHCKILYELIKRHVADTELLLGEINSEKRKKIIDSVKSKHTKVLIATKNLAAEGLDIPSLSCLYLATPTKNKFWLKQASGRIRRPFVNKDNVIVKDIVDMSCQFLRKAAKLRLKFYKEFKYHIINDFTAQLKLKL